MSDTTVQTRVQCNIQCNENSTRSYENLSVSKFYQNCYKHCYIKLLNYWHLKWHYWILAKSWKWLMKNNFNWSWEYKVKGQWDLFILWCSLVNVKRMRKRMRNGADTRSGYTERMRNRYGDKMRNGYGDKMRFFSPHFYVSVFFCNGCNVVLTNYTAISIKECHWDNSQMCNMGAERMMGIIIVLNKFSILVASWRYFQRQLPMQM
jgi:hypothetical protein